MKTVTQEIYSCDHCKKWYRQKHFCVKHEKSCKKNPENHRACHDCVHLTKESTYICEGYNFTEGEIERQVDILFCKKKECFIHPPSVEHKGNAFDTGDYENLPIPKQCEFQTSHFDSLVPFPSIDNL